MSTLTDARLELVAAYVAAELPAFGHTPAVLVPPAVLVKYGSPGITPNRVGPYLSASVTYDVDVVVGVVDYPAAIAQWEELVEAVILATPSGVAVTSVEPPRTDDNPSQGSTLEGTVHLTAQVRETP